MSANERSYYTVSTGSPFSFPTGTSETTILTITPTQNMEFDGIWLDLNNLVQNAILRTKYDMNNNSSYLTFESIIFNASSSNKAVILGRSIPAVYKIRFTIQSLVAEGSSKNIPYIYHYRDLSNIDA